MTETVTFDEVTLAEAFGRRAIEVGHNLSDHPLLQHDAMVDLAARLPPRFIEHHRGLDDELVNADVDVDVIDASPSAIARDIGANGSWMVLWHIEQLPEYRELLDDALRASRALGPARSERPTRSEGYIFLSAPGTVTPAHIDPEHNLLLQIRGTKQFFVGRYPSREHEQRSIERYYHGAHRNLDWLPPADREFTMRPGTGVYVPYLRPHWVLNGPDISISFSATFQTQRRDLWAEVHRLNGRLRARGRSPRPPGSNAALDRAKRIGERFWSRADRLRRGSELRERARLEEIATFSGPGGTRVR